MDFANLYRDTVTIDIDLPDGSPSGISVEVRSKSSDELKAVLRSWQNKLLKAKGIFTADDLANQEADYLVASVANWTWPKGATFAGEDPDNSDAFKRKVLTHKGGEFIADQIKAAMEDNASFFVNSAKA